MILIDIFQILFIFYYYYYRNFVNEIKEKNKKFYFCQQQYFFFPTNVDKYPKLIGKSRQQITVSFFFI